MSDRPEDSDYWWEQAIAEAEYERDTPDTTSASEAEGRARDALWPAEWDQQR
jgi:hypothetical protein